MPSSNRHLMNASEFAALLDSRVGKRYVLGQPIPYNAADPRSLDCSGLIAWAFYWSMAYSMGDDTAAGLYNRSKQVSGSPQVGDMVFLRNNPARPNGIGHVAILTKKLSNGDWRIIEARGRASGVVRTTLSYWKTRRYYAGLRRIPAFKLATTPKPPKDDPAKKPTTGSNLKVGSKGDRVEKLQKGLNAKFPAYSNLKPDGEYGAKTKAVVEEFQRRVGFKGRDIDGVVGPKTLTKLAAHGINLDDTPTPKPDAGAIIIVAGSANAADGNLHAKYRRRLDVALGLLKKDPQRKIVVTGGVKAGRGAESEAANAAAYLKAQGVAAGRILLEDTSGSTHSNFTRALPIAKAAGATSLIVVSDLSHSRRCLAFAYAADQAKKTGLPISGAQWYRDSHTQDATVAQTVEQARAAWPGMTEAIVKKLDAKWGAA
ncbi:MAG: ElyC/SanA/YdcF family protein [Micropruina sp.]